ncbi:MAG: DUF4249 family protein [Cytophagales bacterium]|nr:DUF4249 family protein [Cytophagales bacterium]
MMKKLIFILALPISLLQSCEDVPEFGENETVPVIEAFIYANQPVQNIIIKEVQPFGATEGTEVFLTGLQPQILRNENAFELTESEGNPGHYFYSGTDLIIEIGETYEFSVDFGSVQVTGETTVPSPPIGLTMVTDTLEVPAIEERRDLIRFFQSGDNQLLVEWENLGGAYHYILIRNVEENPLPLDPNELIPFNFNFTSEPTQDDFFNLSAFAHFTQFGSHQLILFRVNPEYALLYESLEQDSRDLNEPFSNITNGVGVFSAFSSDTVNFEILQRPD